MLIVQLKNIIEVCECENLRDLLLLWLLVLELGFLYAKSNFVVFVSDMGSRTSGSYDLKAKNRHKK